MAPARGWIEVFKPCQSALAKSREALWPSTSEHGLQISGLLLINSVTLDNLLNLCGNQSSYLEKEDNV